MIFRNVPLKPFNTFGLDCRADYLVRIRSESELLQFLDMDLSLTKPLLITGAGSNLLFTGNFHGVIINSQIHGIALEEDYPDYVIASAGAGVKWDDFVIWAVENRFGGIENLSWIPGTVGAAPVQNIGAYGAEAKESIERVRAVSLENGSVRIFSKIDCRFAYRDSIFKNDLKGKFLITRVYFRLQKNPVFNLKYTPLEEEVKKSDKITLKIIREAIIKIRRSKLPDPEILGNAGSFFRNPVIDLKTSEILKSKFPDIPVFGHDEKTMKVSAAWLIEQCGWKGKRFGDAGVYEKHALVIVNFGQATGKDILKLSGMIQKSVFEKFGIMLEREVEVI